MSAEQCSFHGIDPLAEPSVALRAAEFINEQLAGTTPGVDAIHQKLFRDGVSCYRLSDTNYELLGVGSLFMHSWAFIDFVAVRRGFREMGLGRKLLKCLEGAAVDGGAHGVSLRPIDQTAADFFARCGYQRDPYSNIMEKNLA